MRLVVLAETLRPRLADPAVRARGRGRAGRQLLQRSTRELADYEHLRMMVVAREPWRSKAAR
jgi:long-chain acyl-CoA synthetase